MYLGVDYYPEHWDISMLEDDIREIKALGANIVRIGEFAWHLMEKEEGKYDFSFFDNVIETLKAHDIKVMFGTPTATFPAWMAAKHPDILSRDENMQPRAFGGRRQYCYSSDVYRDYSARLVSNLVAHYKDEPSIIAWQVDNEFGHEGSDMCYCDQCARDFRLFLKDKYKDILRLNAAYGTIFWGQTYNSFEEIPVPTRTIAAHNPSLQLDWARFRSFTLNRFANEQVELVKSLKGAHQSVTTNVSGGFFTKWFDHAENVGALDFVSYDNYPVWGGLKEPLSSAEIAMTHDFNRGLLRKNYWIVEELMGAQGHTVIGYLPRPNQAVMWSWQAFAHGCTNMLYFRWRGMDRGAEQFCFGIVDQDNVHGRKHREVKKFFKTIQPFEALLNTPIKSEIAVLYDYDNVWSWRFQPQSLEFDFTCELMRLYRPFYRFNANIDVIPVDRDFGDYKVLVIPTLQIIDENLAKRLENFAAQGGTIVFSYRAGIKDKNNNLYLKKIAPCHIRSLCGIDITEIEPLQKGQEVQILGTSSHEGKSGYCEVWRDLVKTREATVIYRYNDMFYEDKACITVNDFGMGKVYYIGGGVDAAVLETLAEEILQEGNIPHCICEDGLEAYPRHFENEDYLVLTNHTQQVKKFENIELGPYESRIVKRNLA